MNPLKGSALSVYAHYAIPSVIGLLALSSASVVDGIFVGNYIGAPALAAVNLCFPVISLVYGYTFMLAIGGSVMAGKHLGQSKHRAASDIFTRVMIAIIISAFALCTTALLLIDSLIPLLGAEPALHAPVKEYLFYLLLLLPAGVIGIALMYFVQVDGRPGYANFSLIMGALINILLDWLLIAEHDMGLTGAALATGLSQCATLLLLLPHSFSRFARLRWGFDQGNWRQLATAAFNGSSEFANEASVGVTTLLFNWVMAARFGVDGVAAYAVISYILFVGVMLSFALADSQVPAISYCLGAKKPKRIRSLMQVSLSTTLSAGIEIGRAHV